MRVFITYVRFQRLNGISAMTGEHGGPEDTPEKPEEERVKAEEWIDTGRQLSSSADLMIYFSNADYSFLCKGPGLEGRL